MQTRPPEAPNDPNSAARGNQPYPPPNRRPARRRSIVNPATPGGCAYYLLLLAWCVGLVVRQTDPAGRSGATWNTGTGVMFAAGVGLVATGLWTLFVPPRSRLAGGWMAVLGVLAIFDAIWGIW